MGKLLMKIHYQLVLAMNFFDVNIVKNKQNEIKIQ